MNKILLIIKREYLSRVNKMSFVVMTLLGPLLLAGIMVIPIWLSNQKSESTYIQVVDETSIFKNIIPSNKQIQFDYTDDNFETTQKNFYTTNYDAILYIPHNLLEGGKSIKIFYKSAIDKSTEEYIASTISKMMYDVILAKNKVNIMIIKDADYNSRIKIISEKLKASGKSEQINSGLYAAIGSAAGILIYIFIFLYSIQVMNGVMEEKNSRIVEVILSSVKPFYFMSGKIIGIALVGLTQFTIWVSLTILLYNVAENTLLKDVEIQQIQQKEEVIKISADLKYNEMKKIEKPGLIARLWNDFQKVDTATIIFCFIFYFLLGYFLYSSMFAAVGAAVDNESDTQQFRLPLTIPLIFSISIIPYILLNLDSTLTYWLSILPFTSPIIMMVRLPFGVPIQDLILSLFILFITFIAIVWISGKVYKTGILMYGKKNNWRELFKWLLYKN